MNINQIVEYYSNDFIASQIVSCSKNREVAAVLFSGQYDKRPNILQYPSDVKQMVKKGISSFHLSVERWDNPMQLARKGYRGRIGWDIIIDIDSKLGMPAAQLAAGLVCDFLGKFGIKNYGVKFSGSRGFHISISWDMFPKEIDYKPLSQRYPEVPRIIASFIRQGISTKLMKELARMKGSVKDLFAILDEPPEKLSPFYFVDIEKNWGNRHLFRAPFSLNEKTWNASVPLKNAKDFSEDDAKPDSIINYPDKYRSDFFAGEKNEALDLLTEALDWHALMKKDEKRALPKRTLKWEKRIDEQHFPPCMKIILAGLSDGRKRSLFTIIHFLRMMNWPWPDIEKKVFDLNEKNKPPLLQNQVISQLRYAKQNHVTPANCANDLYYVSFGICRPDNICKQGTDVIKIKNPIVYPFKKTPQQQNFIRTYQCAVCDKGFRNMKSLRIHKGKTHGIYE